RLEQWRQCRGDAGKGAALPLLPFDPFPRLSVSQVEEVRVAPPHLVLQPRGHLVGGELAELFGDDELEGEMQHQVAQLVTNRARFALAQRMIELERLLDQVRTKGLAGLGAVPWAPCPELAHHGQSTSKR